MNLFKRTPLFIIALTTLLGASVALAQTGRDSLSVTVTPPLFQLSIAPGEQWSSSMKVVNSNRRDVTYYAEVMDFDSQDEAGKANLLPAIDELTPREESYSLASWVTLPDGPIVVGAGQSGEVPFTVTVPADAEPGGHYAAILIGTKPQDSGISGPRVSVSSYVSSLLFVRIKGEVDERARIREFRALNSLYQTPSAEFLLRLENMGNVHVRPQGEITIFNMWGKERGKFEIHQKSGFGNVLPGSTRRFEFTWKGEDSSFDIGRYSAEVALSYGDDQKKTVTARTYFWVIPVVPVSIGLGTLLLFIVSLVFFVRRYVRRALVLEHERLGIPAHTPASISLNTLIEPIRQGAVDLRETTQRDRVAAPPISVGASEHLTFGRFLRKYALFFSFLVFFVASALVLFFYLSTVLVPERSYEISGVESIPEVE